MNWLASAQLKMAGRSFGRKKTTVYEINPGFETGPNGHRTLVCTPKLDKYLKMP
jgi:hypothetical protein